MEQRLRYLFSTDSEQLDELMQLTSIRSQKYFYLDWWLMNHCSWQCSYCHDIIKSGSIDLPYIQDCTRFVDQLGSFSEGLGKILNINFTGGEVTEWNNFAQLLEYAHRQGCFTQFRSNANVSASEWLLLMKSTNSVILEFHPEHTQSSQFLIAVNNAVNQGVSVKININMLKESWQELEDLANYIREKWPSVTVNKKMLFQDPVFNASPVQYEDQQVAKLKIQTGDLKLNINGQEQHTDYQTLILENKNTFNQWQCWAGLEQMVVDAWGRVYRAHCRHNGFVGNLKDQQLKWPTEPLTCPVSHCRNNFDISATKIKP
jgi:MoaA/NifB/PqqE/SkfB family radical SAM enzyme